jgi:hypothetical protein
MRKPTLSLAAAALAAILLPAMAYAQAGLPYDHLSCFRVKDPVRGVYAVDLVPLQTPTFSKASGCRLRVPAKLFCVPVQKTNVKPAPPLTVNGVQAQDYLVYQVACPKGVVNAGQPLDVKDQFGARPIVVGNQLLLLVPAYKKSRLCQNTAPAGAAPQCGGECTDPGQKCVQVPGTTTCQCESPCGRDSVGECSGTCPYPTQDCHVVGLSSGALGCTCAPPVDGCTRDAATGQCGGPCPEADESCVTDTLSGTCKCEKPCGAIGIRQCGGPCPTANESCQMKPDDSGCECKPTTTQQPCGPDPLSGQCGGVCPNNLPCLPGNAATGPCICG